MDRFLELLREELERLLAVGGNYSNKPAMLAAFDRASIKALSRYAKEKNIDLT